MSLLAVERRALETFRSGKDPFDLEPQADTTSAWILFALGALLEAGRGTRGLRLESLRNQTHIKEDTTPVTVHERQIESRIRMALKHSMPEVAFLGEEGGGTLPAHGTAVALDPVDGTWAFLNRTSTFATSLAVFQDAVPYIGAVMNPATGEIGYAVQQQRTRLIQLDLLGERDVASDLPLDRAGGNTVLVNVHPCRDVQPLVSRLIEAWSADAIHLVRMEGGSPANALLESAKGTFIYVNLWRKTPAEPFDLASGVLLVESAGGQVLDLSGNAIDANAHSGVFVAGVDRAACEQVLEIARMTPDH